MKPTIYVLLPGLGDAKPLFGWFYRRVASSWARSGMSASTLPMRWVSDEPFEQKYARLADVVAEQKRQGREVVLVGVSAGASLGLLAYCRDAEITAFISICGFIDLSSDDRHNEALMKLSWYRAADAAERAARKLAPQRRRGIMALRARTDRVIEPTRQRIAGATNLQLKSFGHLLSIGVALWFMRRRIRAFVTSIG